MIGTVPVYDSVIHYQRDLSELTAQDFVDVVRLHAEDGVDFVTLHCGITRKTIMFKQIMARERAITGFISLLISGCVGIVMAYNGLASLLLYCRIPSYRGE